MLVIASVTDHLVSIGTDFIREVGLPGIFVLMTANATAIPFPSEATMLFAGFNVHEGHQTFLGITAAGVLGDVAGSTIAYLVGYYGRTGILERHGGKLHVSPERLARVEDFFERRGTPAIFFGRMIPFVRNVIAFPAGSARMPYLRFAGLTALGAIPWVVGFGLLGRGVGSKWHEWRDKLAYVDYAFALLVIVGIVYMVVRSRRAPREETTGSA